MLLQRTCSFTVVPGIDESSPFAHSPAHPTKLSLRGWVLLSRDMGYGKMNHHGELVQLMAKETQESQTGIPKRSKRRQLCTRPREILVLRRLGWLSLTGLLDSS